MKERIQDFKEERIGSKKKKFIETIKTESSDVMDTTES